MTTYLKFDTTKFDKTVATGTLSTSVAQVNAAYNLAATRFVKQWLAFHDREIKTQLATMAESVSGSAIEKIKRATDTAIRFDKANAMEDLTGLVILRPVGIKNIDSYIGRMIALGDPTTAAGVTFGYDDIRGENDGSYRYYNGLSEGANNRDDDTFVIFSSDTMHPTRSHRGLAEFSKINVLRGDAQQPEAVGPTQTEKIMANKYQTVYSLVKGNLFRIINEGGTPATDNPFSKGAKERNLWEEVIVLREWATGLPDRPTLQSEASFARKRDATMFEAMRLDLVGNDIRNLLASFEANGITSIDFDAMPFPFEERLHFMSPEMVEAKLNAFSWWVTRCLFDNDGTENVASKQIWEKAHESTHLVDLDDFDHTTFKSKAELVETDAISNTFLELIKKKFEKKTENGVLFFSACEQQFRPEVFPYVLPMIDLSGKTDLVWGSTITPFLLSVIAVASTLSKLLLKDDGTDSVQLKSWKYDGPKVVGGGNTGNVFDDSTDATPEAISKRIVERFRGFHFSNRKALNNGVYAVLFADESSDNTEILTQALTDLEARIKAKVAEIDTLADAADIANANAELETLRATKEAVEQLFAKLQSLFGRSKYNGKQILVNVNGRIPLDIETVEEEESILKWLYYYIHGFAFPHLETGRKMTGLIEPYCVFIKGPGENALATEMQFGNHYYATSIMIALENEACQLLGHIARDNKKRKRDQHYAVAEIFASNRITDFNDLQSEIKKIPIFKHKEFAAALVRLVRAIKSFNDCLNDAGKTTRDRVVMGRIDGERMITAQEVLYGGWSE